MRGESQHENAFERLYSEAKKKKEVEERQPKSAKKPVQHSRDSVDIEEDLLVSKPATQEVDVYKKLTERQLEVEKKKAKRKEDQEGAFKFQPVINTNSNAIAKTVERIPLTSPIKSPVKHANSVHQQEPSPQQESPSKNSKFEVNGFWERKVQKERQKHDKIKSMRRFKEQEEMKECTFRPNINTNTEKLANLWFEGLGDVEEMYEFDPRYSENSPTKNYLKKRSSTSYVDYSHLSNEKRVPSQSASPAKQVDSPSSIIDTVIGETIKDFDQKQSKSPQFRNLSNTSYDSDKPVFRKRASYSISSSDEDEEFESLEKEMKSAIQEFEEWSQLENLHL